MAKLMYLKLIQGPKFMHTCDYSDKPACASHIFIFSFLQFGSMTP